VWWMTEAVPLAVTALLPLVLYPLLGIMKTSDVSVNYANHLVFLFMGGFIIAIALQKWNLHRRFALHTIALIGSNPRNVILAFMIATALLSMWISNTATAIMMLPIGLAVIHQLQGDTKGSELKPNLFGMVLMLAIAYSASIGGISTLIGTPPNVVFSGIYGKYFPDHAEISFSRWMINILPLTVILFGIVWFYLIHIILKKENLPRLLSKKIFQRKRAELGPISNPQVRVLVLFVITALLWIFRAGFNLGNIQIPGWPDLFGLQAYIQDSTIAMGMAILLFIIPAESIKSPKALLNWKDLLALPWDILLLFGGGFALADGIQKTGLAEFLGKQLAFLGSMHVFIMLLLVALSVVFLTELTSNTAVATTILPILAALAIDLKLDPLLIMLPATIGASCAFMLPVATPPNAIVFGSRLIPIQKMVRMGFFLNLAVALTLTVYFYMIYG
ncbi:MAG: SLC13 family permease, partial [Calditrichia bacterium]